MFSAGYRMNIAQIENNLQQLVKSFKKGNFHIRFAFGLWPAEGINYPIAKRRIEPFKNSRRNCLEEETVF